MELPRPISPSSTPARLGHLAIWVASVTGIVTAVVTEATWADRPAARIFAAAVGVVVGAAIALVSWSVITAAQQAPHADPVVERRVADAPTIELPPAEPSPTRSALEPELERGIALRAGESASADREAWAADVDRWIEATGRRVEEHAPQFAAYFVTASLGRAAGPAARLERHLARLRTIVVDSL